MKSAPASQIRVGLVILASLIVLGGAIFFMGKERRLFERKVFYGMHFARAAGLREGAPVTLSGVSVGSVESLRFPSDPRESYVVVQVRIVGEAAPRIRRDTIAQIRTHGMLGDKYIELKGGSAQSEPLPPGSLISSVTPLDYEALLGESGDVIQNFTEATASLKAILKSIEKGEGMLGQLVASDKGAKWDETAGNLRSASASLKNILGSVEKGEGIAGQLVRNKEAGQKMVESLDRLAKVTESLQRTAEKIEKGEGTLGTLIQDPDAGREILAGLRRSTANLEGVTRQLREGGGIFQRLIADKVYADRVLGHLEQTTEDLAEITGKIERGEGTIGALVNDPELYQEAKGLVGDVKESWLFSIYRFFRGLGSSNKDSPSEKKEGEK